MQSYYEKGTNQFGSVTEDELRAKLAAGEVVGADRLWREGISFYAP